MLTMSADEARKNPLIDQALAAELQGDYDVAGLLSGDFASLDTPIALGVERKTFPNFAGSLGSGELDEQLTTLLTTYDLPVLILEGMPRADHNGKLPLYGAKREVTHAWVVGSLVGWAARGVWTMRTEDQVETVQTLVFLYRFAAKTLHRKFYTPRRLLPNLRELSLGARMMSMFAGVGPGRAAKFVGRAPADLAGMTEEQWQEELGKVTGRKVYEQWQGQ